MTNRRKAGSGRALARWVGALLFLSAPAVGWADLDEKGFEFYKEGELLDQDNWWPQGIASATSPDYVNTPGRVEVTRDSQTKGQWIVWKAGFGGKNQTRLIKRSPATTGAKALVRFDFRPGSENLGGRLYFEHQAAGGTALQFINGTLHVLEAGQEAATDTGRKFQAADWNHFELRFDFEKHQVAVWLDGRSLGRYLLPPALTQLNQLNFFAGGETFASALDNLSIQSVEKFPGAPSAAENPKREIR